MIGLPAPWGGAPVIPIGPGPSLAGASSPASKRKRPRAALWLAGKGRLSRLQLNLKDLEIYQRVDLEWTGWTEASLDGLVLVYLFKEMG